jgi:hypothetical protein
MINSISKLIFYIVFFLIILYVINELIRYYFYIYGDLLSKKCIYKKVEYQDPIYHYYFNNLTYDYKYELLIILFMSIIYIIINIKDNLFNNSKNNINSIFLIIYTLFSIGYILTYLIYNKLKYNTENDLNNIDIHGFGLAYIIITNMIIAGLCVFDIIINYYYNNSFEIDIIESLLVFHFITIFLFYILILYVVLDQKQDSDIIYEFISTDFKDLRKMSLFLLVSSIVFILLIFVGLYKREFFKMSKTKTVIIVIGIILFYVLYTNILYNLNLTKKNNKNKIQEKLTIFNDKLSTILSNEEINVNTKHLGADLNDGYFDNYIFFMDKIKNEDDDSYSYEVIEGLTYKPEFIYTISKSTERESFIYDKNTGFYTPSGKKCNINEGNERTDVNFDLEQDKNLNDFKLKLFYFINYVNYKLKDGKDEKGNHRDFENVIEEFLYYVCDKITKYKTVIPDYNTKDEINTNQKIDEIKEIMVNFRKELKNPDNFKYDEKKKYPNNVNPLIIKNRILENYIQLTNNDMRNDPTMIKIERIDNLYYINGKEACLFLNMYELTENKDFPLHLLADYSEDVATLKEKWIDYRKTIIEYDKIDFTWLFVLLFIFIYLLLILSSKFEIDSIIYIIILIILIILVSFGLNLMLIVNNFDINNIINKKKQ